MPTSLPNLMYHYTTIEVLVSIVERGEIWFSDPRFMNDAREIHHAVEIVCRMIPAIAERHRQAYLDKGLSQELFESWVKGLGDTLRRRMIQQTIVDEKSFPFIFCLSEKDDDLSQWRAYGDCCIGFDVEILKNAASGKMARIQYCDANADHESVRSVVDGFFRSHLVHVVGRGEIKGLDPEVRYDGISDITSVLKRNGFFLSLKDKRFESEAEHRLIARKDPRDEQVFLHGSGRYPTPKVKISIADRRKEAIRRITFGPGADRERATYAIDMMRLRFDLPTEWDCSSIPYRTDR